MRRIAALALPALLLAGFVPGPASAQMWPNDVGPRRDMLELALQPLQRFQPPPSIAPAAAIPPPPVAPLPVWTQPVPAQPARTAPRRVARSTPPRTPPQAQQPQPSAAAIGDLEQRLAGREKQLEEMRRQIETDRRSLQALRSTSDNGAKPAASVSSTIQ